MESFCPGDQVVWLALDLTRYAVVACVSGRRAVEARRLVGIKRPEMTTDKFLYSE